MLATSLCHPNYTVVVIESLTIPKINTAVDTPVMPRNKALQQQRFRLHNIEVHMQTIALLPHATIAFVNEKKAH